MTSPQRHNPGERHRSNPTHVTAYETTTGKYIFTETGNGEAWIVTDVVVEPEV